MPDNRIFSRRWAHWGRATGRWLTSGPISLAIAVVLVGVFVLSLVLPSQEVEGALRAGLGEAWWTIFTAWAAVRSLAQLVFDVLLLVTLGIALERVLGSRSFLLVGALSYWVGALLALATVKLVEVVDPRWGDLMSREAIVGVSALLLAVAAAASVRLAPLWRRRLQTFVVTVLVILVLFAGYLGALFTVYATACGLLAGALLAGREHPRTSRTELVGGGPQDGRFLVALIVSGVVVGSVMSISTTHMVGVLAHLQYLAGMEMIDPALGTCTGEVVDNCGYYQGLLSPRGLHILVPQLLQLALAWGLHRGRHAALVGTLTLQGTSVALGLANLIILWGHRDHWDVYGMNSSVVALSRLAATVAIPLIIGLIVWSTRSLFTVRTAPGTARNLLIKVGVATLVSWAVAVLVALFWAGAHDPGAAVLRTSGSFLLALLPSPSLIVDLGAAGTDPIWPVGTYLALVPWVVLGVLMLAAFRQQQLPQAIGRSQFIEMTRRFGAGSMGWIATWRGNHYWSSQTGEGAVAYRAGGGVALTVTDPVCAPERARATMEEFVAFSLEQGLVPAFYSIHQDSAEVARQWGWPVLQVAEETVLDLPTLAFTGKKFQDVRTALNRAQKEGITAQWVRWESCDSRLKAQISAISKQWVEEKPLPEMGFTLGGLDELDDPEVRILLAVDGEGRVHGVTSWMPIYQRGEVTGWTLDFMRRRDGGFKPVMEFLIASAALWAQEEGYRQLSLSGAPLARAAGSEDADSSAPLDWVLNLLGEALEPVYGFRSLLQFKAKFKPRYEPIYLTVPTLGALPGAGLAIGHAYLPDLRFVQTVELGRSLRPR